MLLKKLIISLFLIIGYQFTSAQDYFPLHEGDVWYFDNIPYSVDSTIQLENFNYFVAPRHYENTHYYRKDTIGNVYGFFDGVDTLIYKFSGDVGDSWEIPWDNDIRYGIEIISKNDSVILWNDTLRNCVKLLRYGINITDATQYLWFAENLGIVKIEDLAWGPVSKLNKGVFDGIRYPSNSEFLMVESTIPFKGQTNIPANGIITVSFNYKIKPEFLSAEFIEVTYDDGSVISGDINYSADSKAVVFHPSKNFECGSKIKVNISSVIEDYIGDTLEANYTFHFYIEEESEPQDVFTLVDSVSLDYKNRFGNYSLKDIDHDGGIDFVYATALTGSDSVYIWKNENMSFSLLDCFSTGSAVSSLSDLMLEWIDFNNDDLEDLIYLFNTSNNSTTIELYKNIGNKFEHHSSVDVDKRISSIDVGDYDNDNLDDILLGIFPIAQSSYELFILKNKINFFETVTVDIFCDDDHNNSRWVDINNDGKLDVILLSNNLSGIRFLIQKNNNFELWDKRCNSTKYIYPRSAVYSCDYDFDGDTDIFIDGYLLEQIESGFIRNYNIEKMTYPVPKFYDYDNDRYPDLYIAGTGEDAVGREQDYINIYSNSKGKFTIQEKFIAPYEDKYFSKWNDFDKNGSLDAIYYNREKLYFFSNHKYVTNVKIPQTKQFNFALSQNYPNPFNPSTTIKYTIPLDVRRETSNVRLVIYDILGREIKTLVNKPLQPGSYEAEFNGAGLPSGVYLYRLTAGEYSNVRKMLLLK